MNFSFNAGDGYDFQATTSLPDDHGFFVINVSGRPDEKRIIEEKIKQVVESAIGPTVIKFQDSELDVEPGRYYVAIINSICRQNMYSVLDKFGCSKEQVEAVQQARDEKEDDEKSREKAIWSYFSNGFLYS